MDIKLEQSQKQVLSHKLLQSVEILQMNAQELTDYVKELSMENPVLELEDSVAEDKVQDRMKKLEWLASLDEQNRAFYQYDKNDEENDYMNNLAIRHADTLKDTLMLQLISGGYTSEELEIFEYIADSLDHNGYFTESVSDLSRRMGKTEEEIARCLAIMKNLEPAGVCAGSLQECLLIQLQEDPDSYQNEITIIEKYMDLLGKNQLHVIAKNMKLCMEDVKEAVDNIKSLNPRPAQGYDNNDMLRYIVPDITVVKLPDHMEILLNNYSYPVLHVNQQYLRMMKTDCDQELKDYLMEKINQVSQVKEAMERRGSTLLELGRCIVDVQSDFFMYGPGYIRPFMMKDAAVKLNVHESTISRTAKGKYLHCCWGTYPLNYFFSRTIHNSEDASADIATAQIKERIRKLIESEDKKKPYSDKKLSELLKEEGIELSRRTVVKYRECMGIANSRGRKEF